MEASKMTGSGYDEKAPADFCRGMAEIRSGFRLWHQYGSSVPYEAVLEAVRNDAGQFKTWPCDPGSLTKNQSSF